MVAAIGLTGLQSRNRLNEWAKSEGLTLLEARYVWRF
jgi:hypothetical protein